MLALIRVFDAMDTGLKFPLVEGAAVKSNLAFTRQIHLPLLESPTPLKASSRLGRGLDPRVELPRKKLLFLST